MVLWDDAVGGSNDRPCHFSLFNFDPRTIHNNFSLAGVGLAFRLSWSTQVKAGATAVILADEPTGNLDSKTSGEIMGLLQELNAKGSTIVMVTHSRQCARFADRIMRVADGRLAEAA